MPDSHKLMGSHLVVTCPSDSFQPACEASIINPDLFTGYSLDRRMLWLLANNGQIAAASFPSRPFMKGSRGTRPEPAQLQGHVWPMRELLATSRRVHCHDIKAGPCLPTWGGTSSLTSTLQPSQIPPPTTLFRTSASPTSQHRTTRLIVRSVTCSILPPSPLF